MDNEYLYGDELLAKQYGEETARRWTGENQQAIFEMPLI